MPSQYEADLALEEHGDLLVSLPGVSYAAVVLKDHGHSVLILHAKRATGVHSRR